MKEYEYIGKAMGTEFSISIVCDAKEDADTLADQAIEQIHSYEKKFSRFIPSSELSMLNDKKSLKVSEDFIEIISEAHRLYLETQGVFNPLVQIERFGYNKDYKKITDTKKLSIVQKKYDVDFSLVTIDKEKSTIHLQKDQRIDLGGFLKGYLAEKLCKQISNSNKVQGAIVNIGGDLHTQGLDEHNKHFIFTIHNPVSHLDDIDIPVHNQSLATSGTYKRTWQTSGELFHHILDSTGSKNPENAVLSASIICDHGGDSEAFAKFFISIPIEHALKIISEKDIHYIIIKQDGNIITNTK